jgi:GTPase SAR1 family protein
MSRRSASELDNDYDLKLDRLGDLLNFLLINGNTLPKYIGIPIENLIPYIIVVGNQSAGKSSVLSALTGIDFPIGDGRTTICRIEVRKRRSQNVSKIISYSNDGKTDVSEKFAINAEAVKIIHENLRLKMEGRSFLNDYIIVVEMSGPDEQNITFVDLPGLFAPRADGSEKYPVMCLEKYINLPNCQIVNILSAVEDIHISISNFYVTQTDPTRSRTVNVFTKLDLVDNIDSFLTTVKNFDPKAILTINRVRNTQITATGEFERLQPFTWNYKGRNVILTRLENFIENFLEANGASLRSSLRSLLNELNFGLTEIGEQPLSSFSIQQRWIIKNQEIISRLRSSPDFLKWMTDAVEKLQTVANTSWNETIFTDEDLLHEMEVQRGLQIHFLAGNEALHKRYCQIAVSLVQPEIINFIDDILTLSRRVIAHIMLNTDSSCLNAFQTLSTTLTSIFTAENARHKHDLEETLVSIHQNPTLLSDSNIISKVYDVRFDYLAQVEGLTSRDAVVFFVETQRRNRAEIIRQMQIKEFRAVISEYWRTRMSNVQINLHERLTKIIDSLFEEIQKSIVNFSQTETLKEVPEILTKRANYQRARTLVNETLLTLN